MKYLRFSLVLGVLVLLAGVGQTGWISQNSGTTAMLSSVYFPVDAQTGFVVGGAGTILKTTDGGWNWVSQNSGTANHLYSVLFPVDVQTGYAVGEGGTILKTTDGGANWASLRSGFLWDLNSVHFPVDVQTGYVVGGDGCILKTTDGGVGVESDRGQGFEGPRVQVTPNPFTSFATIPGHSSERFILYDISGRKVGTYKGDRIGERLSPGIYFLKQEGKDGRPVRVVKVR